MYGPDNIFWSVESRIGLERGHRMEPNLARIFALHWISLVLETGEIGS